MPKIDIYKCNTCKRTIEIDQDFKRPFISKCTITMNCVGELSKIR